MPIYAYRCTSCGHAKDVLQKISDPLLRLCPACGASTFAKQVTAAGFQLKGSGWYVTDFRGGNKDDRKAPAEDKPGESAKPPESETAAPAKPAADAPAAAAAPAAPAVAAPAPPSGGS